MRAVVLDPASADFEWLLERRRRLGLDIYDEMWEGVYHMAPMARSAHGYLDRQVARLLGPYAEAAGLVDTGAFNLGEPEDFRVPDAGMHRGDPDPDAVYLPTAALVVEIVSPGDETWDKLPFYAACGVEEVIIVDYADRRARVFALSGSTYAEVLVSEALGIGSEEIGSRIRWP